MHVPVQILQLSAYVPVPLNMKNCYTFAKKPQNVPCRCTFRPRAGVFAGTKQILLQALARKEFDFQSPPRARRRRRHPRQDDVADLVGV